MAETSKITVILIIIIIDQLTFSFSSFPSRNLYVSIELYTIPSNQHNEQPTEQMYHVTADEIDLVQEILQKQRSSNFSKRTHLNNPYHVLEDNHSTIETMEMNPNFQLVVDR